LEDYISQDFFIAVVWFGGYKTIGLLPIVYFASNFIEKILLGSNIMKGDQMEKS
jgi:hypothetical protein